MVESACQPIKQGVQVSAVQARLFADHVLNGLGLSSNKAVSVRARGCECESMEASITG
jgi:hypothetical protein